jgi:hypothetical protein
MTRVNFAPRSSVFRSEGRSGVNPASKTPCHSKHGKEETSWDPLCSFASIGKEQQSCEEYWYRLVLIGDERRRSYPAEQNCLRTLNIAE